MGARLATKIWIDRRVRDEREKFEFDIGDSLPLTV